MSFSNTCKLEKTIVIKWLCYYTVYITDHKYIIIDQNKYIHFLPQACKKKNNTEMNMNCS